MFFLPFVHPSASPEALMSTKNVNFASNFSLFPTVLQPLDIGCNFIYLCALGLSDNSEFAAAASAAAATVASVAAAAVAAARVTHSVCSLAWPVSRLRAETGRFLRWQPDSSCSSDSSSCSCSSDSEDTQETPCCCGGCGGDEDDHSQKALHGEFRV